MQVLVPLYIIAVLSVAYMAYKFMTKDSEPASHITVGEGYSLTAAEHARIDLTIADSSRKGHTWVFGTTRVGKTRALENMVEQDIRKGNSVVVIDPKGDLELFSKIIQVAFEEKRHQDLILVTPIFPSFSAVLDPLAYYYMPEELVGHIVSGIEVGKEKFFYNVAYEISLIVVQSLILIARHEGKQVSFNLNDVKNYISRESISELKAQIDSIDSNEARQLSQDMDKVLASPADYYGKVSSSLRVALMELSSGNIGKIVGKADSNRFMRKLENGERVIMVVHLGSLLTRKAAYTLGKVVVSMIQSFTGRVFSSGKTVNPPLCLYIDEAQNVLYFGIDDLFAKSGGANVWVHGFCQSVSQIYAAIGEDYGNAILDNTNTKMFMRVPDAETAEYVVRHFGTHKVMSPIVNVSGGMATREVEEDILKPSDILNLPPRQFYMLTYSGTYKGKTCNISDLYIDIKFPDVETETAA